MPLFLFLYAPCGSVFYVFFTCSLMNYKVEFFFVHSSIIVSALVLDGLLQIFLTNKPK